MACALSPLNLLNSDITWARLKPIDSISLTVDSTNGSLEVTVVSNPSTELIDELELLAPWPPKNL